MPVCLPAPGEPPGLEEVLHGGHHQRVLLGAHHLVERGEQLIQGRCKAWRPRYHEFVRCHCRPLTRLHHMDHTVSSCLTCAGEAPPHLPPITSNTTMPLLKANSMFSSCHRPLHTKCPFSG